MRMIFGLINKCGAFLQKMTGRAEEKFADPESKKISDPKKIKTFVIAMSIALIATIVAVSLMNEKDLIGNGIKDFEKQKGVKFGISRAKNEDKIGQLDAFDKIEQGESQSPYDICNSLHEKVKGASKLNATEYETFKKCLNDGTIYGVDAKQRKALEMLGNPEENLTQEEMNLLQEVANGTLDPNSERAKIADALMSDDSLRKGAAQKLLDPTTSQEDRDLYNQFLNGKLPREVVEGMLSEDPSVREAAKKLASQLSDPNAPKAETDKARSQLGDANLNNTIANNGTIADPAVAEAVSQKINAMEQASSDMGQDLTDKDNLNKALEKAVKDIEGKRARGEELNDEDKALLDQHKELKKQSEDMKARLKQTQDEIINLKKRLASLPNDMYKTYESEDGEIVEEFDTRKKIVRKPIIKKTERRVSPSEYQLVQKIKSIRRSGDYEASLLPNMDTASFGVEILAKAISSTPLNPLANYNLAPDLKIPCVIESASWVSSADAAGRRIICRIADNVYNPENDQILLPKGSRAIGVTSGFDPNTRLMTVNFTKVRVGTKTHDIGFILVDSTGKQGLPGGVLSTRNKKITAAVLTDFAAGITQFFATQAQYQLALNGANSMNIVNSVTGAGFQGLSSGITKIAETLTQDLQNSPDVFFSPAGMKMILMPQ